MSKKFAANVAKWSKTIIGLKTLTKQAAKDAAKELERLAKKVARTEKNPYGVPWAERKHVYKHPILNRTGKLIRGTRVTANGDEITASNSVKYAIYHQKGTKHLPVRLVVPRGTLPETWRVVLVKHLQKQWKNRTGRK